MRSVSLPPSTQKLLGAIVIHAGGVESRALMSNFAREDLSCATSTMKLKYSFRNSPCRVKVMMSIKQAFE